MKLFTNFLDLAVLEMNLKKYTKADLISKVENLQNKMNSKSTRTNSKFLINQIKVYFSQVWDLILTFKNLLFKLTLISLIIKYFKKIKLIRKIWIIINTIVMGIFGISIFENSLFDFFSNIIYEIRFISGNIIDYLTNTNFYKYLNNLFSNNKIIENKDIIENKEIINNKNKLVNKNENDLNEYTKKIKTENQKWKNKLLEDTKSKLANWINPVKEVIEQPDIESNYKKYLYLTAIIITTSLTWYYFDEIKTGGVSLIEWLMSFRAGPGDGTGNDSNNSSTHIESNIPIDTSDSDVIEVLDKGKTRVLSPSTSFENLNEKIKESWSEGSNSPSSSTETITPYNTSEVQSLNTSSSSATSLNIFEFIRKNWRTRLDDDTKTKMDFIERSIELDLNKDDALKLTTYLADIFINYNKDVETYNFIKSSATDIESLEGYKQSLFYFRKWISKYQGIILPESTIIEKGSIIDSPKILNKDIFE
jgi:hypothetical protein